MIRSHLFALTVLFVASRAFASVDAPPTEAALTGGVDQGVDLEEEAVADDEEYYDEEVDFCGDGEMTIVDMAFNEMTEDPEGARDMLVDALRAGEIEDWLRPYALVTLAEAQLTLGQTSAAVRNYQKAFELDAAAAGESARVGLSVALMAQTRRKAAHETATLAASAVCTDRYSQVACYGARLVLSLTSRDAAERAAAREQAASLRAASPWLAVSFDAVDARVARAGR